jgi:hypothetical protein
MAVLRKVMKPVLTICEHEFDKIRHENFSWANFLALFRCPRRTTGLNLWPFAPFSATFGPKFETKCQDKNIQTNKFQYFSKIKKFHDFSISIKNGQYQNFRAQ